MKLKGFNGRPAIRTMGNFFTPTNYGHIKIIFIDNFYRATLC